MKLNLKFITVSWSTVYVSLLCLPFGLFAANSVHVGIHRHLHQPIYWGEPDPNRPNQVQFGHASVLNKLAGNAYYGDTIQHPDNILVGGNDSVFEDPDKVNAYQNWIKGSISQMNHPDAGMTISYSGALQRNLWDFGHNNAYGYSPNWNSQNIEAHGWTTSSGNSKAEVLGQTYNHAFSPLLPKSVLRKQIEMHQERTRKSWGLAQDSKGFWPIELAFSRHMIDVLVEYGYEWVMIPNSHLARTCQNYEQKADEYDILRADPPNKADLLGPHVPDAQWYQANRDTYGNAFPVPFAYQLHKAKYVNPDTGAESKITVVPQCDYHGYQSGYSQVGWEHINGIISQHNDPNKPSLVMLTNDGENFWGGGYSFWMEFAPNFMNEAAGHGKKPTTIGQFVSEHPPADTDVVHVEDGSWLAADQGSPQFYRWLEPPRRISGIDWSDPNSIFDIENGWHSDMRNWAVMFAGINYCETAEQIHKDNGGDVQVWRIEEPYQDNGTYNNPNAVEQAWHFLMWGFDSGFIYFDPFANDDEVKHTFAANRAISLAQPIIGDGSQDQTPPTVFKPQRFPWNPGGKGKGQYLGGLTSGNGTVGYSTPVWSSDFYIWTVGFDVSGISQMTLKIRVDADGTNPLGDNANETYAGGNGVGAWTSIPMNSRVMPKDDPTNNPGFRFFRLPDYISDYFWVKVNGYRGQLLDYYIEAVDTKGNVHKSEIQHVFVEDDGTPGGNTTPSSVTFSDDPNDCTPLTVSYHVNDGALTNAANVTMIISFDNEMTWEEHPMNSLGNGQWEVTVTPSNDAPKVIVTFHNGLTGSAQVWDGKNFSTNVRDCESTGPSVLTFNPSNPVGCDPVTITYYPNEGPLAGASSLFVHIGHDGWQDVITPPPAMTQSGNAWTYTYAFPAGSTSINVVVNDGSNWDNNEGNNWNVSIMNCSLGPVLDITDPASNITVPNSQTHYLLSGTAHSSLQGKTLIWSNELTGMSGMQAATQNWTIAPGISLHEGVNPISVLVVEDTTLAHDTANDATYSTGWSGNGGSGWTGDWILTTDGSNAGHFIATTANNPSLETSTTAFGLWANSGDPANAWRVFGSDLSPGNIFSLSFENGWIDSNGSAGIYLQNASGETLWGFRFLGGETNYQILDGSGAVDTGMGFTSEGMPLMFTLTSSNTYHLSAGNDTFSGSLMSQTDLSIHQVLAANVGCGPGDNYNFYINDLSITGPGSTILGSDMVNITRDNNINPDSDSDGITDAWEITHFGNLNTATSTSDWDGDGSKDVDEFCAGTEPKNAASNLHIMDIMRTGDVVTVIWSSIGGKKYKLLYINDLNNAQGSWNSIATGMLEDDVPVGQADTMEADDTLTPDQRYYKVQLDTAE